MCMYMYIYIYIYMYNPISWSWLLRNVEYDGYFREHFEYDATFNIQVHKYIVIYV